MGSRYLLEGENLVKNRKWVLVTVAAVSSAASAMAAPSIGVATANGTFMVNGASVSGNATVMDGSKINTAGTSSLVQLNGGARVNLAANSGTQVFHDRAVIERGGGQITSKGDYRVEAGVLRIESASGASEMRVKLGDKKVVEVAAVRGNLLVKNTSGIVLASMVPGTALSFDAQDAGASLGVSVNGTMRKVADHVYIITDTTSQITYQVVGCEDYARKVDNNVKVEGTLVQNATLAQPAITNGATQEIRVRGCNAVAAVAVGAAAGAAAYGLTTGAVVAGVAVAAAGTGIGLGVALNQDPGVSTQSP